MGNLSQYAMEKTVSVISAVLASVHTGGKVPQIQFTVLVPKTIIIQNAAKKQVTSLCFDND